MPQQDKKEVGIAYHTADIRMNGNGTMSKQITQLTWTLRT